MATDMVLALTMTTMTTIVAMRMTVMVATTAVVMTMMMAPTTTMIMAVAMVGWYTSETITNLLA